MFVLTTTNQFVCDHRQDNATQTHTHTQGSKLNTAAAAAHFLLSFINFHKYFSYSLSFHFFILYICFFHSFCLLLWKAKISKICFGMKIVKGNIEKGCEELWWGGRKNWVWIWLNQTELTSTQTDSRHGEREAILKEYEANWIAINQHHTKFTQMLLPKLCTIASIFCSHSLGQESVHFVEFDTWNISNRTWWLFSLYSSYFNSSCTFAS